jgi:hypothetical protein
MFWGLTGFCSSLGKRSSQLDLLKRKKQLRRWPLRLLLPNTFSAFDPLAVVLGLGHAEPVAEWIFDDR